MRAKVAAETPVRQGVVTRSSAVGRAIRTETISANPDRRSRGLLRDSEASSIARRR